MSTVNFDTAVYFNGYEFFTYNELAVFLIDNYSNAINLIKDNALFEIIKEGSLDLYNEIYNATKDFEYCENVLTFIIYRLSDNPLFVTQHNKFESTYDMALAMKRSYPDINNDVLILLKDKVLSKIYWDEYLFTQDVRHKRNHDFLVNVEENQKYLFSYFYLLVLHLPSTEKFNFIINNVKFESIDELISYLYTNQKYIQQVITEIKRNDFVLGLIASKTSINNVAVAVASDNYIDFLYLINTMNQNNETQTFDFTAVLNTKMCVWLAYNYQNYNYESTPAKKLLKEYSKIVKRKDLSFLELFKQVKELEVLYKRFLELYNSDRILSDEGGISTENKDFHLGYFHNDEIVCCRYLTEYDLVKEDIFTPEYILSQEKTIVINKLEKTSADLQRHNDLLTEYYSYFNNERFKLVTYKNAILLGLLLPLLIGFILIYLGETSYISVHEQFFTRVLGAIGILLTGVTSLIIMPEYNKLSEILKNQKKFKKYNKKINKTKIIVTNMKYYKEAVITEDNVEAQNEDNSIVEKRISLKFIKKYNKFYEYAIKINKRNEKVKEINFNILAKLAIAVAFLPALIFANQIVFNILDKELIYPIVEEFGFIYLLLTFANIVFISNKKAYRNTFLFYIVSVIATVLINML